MWTLMDTAPRSGTPAGRVSGLLSIQIQSDPLYSPAKVRRESRAFLWEAPTAGVPNEPVCRAF